MSVTAVVSEKGQVTLPKALRDRLDIVPGARLSFDLDADGTLRVRVLASGADALFGLLAKPGERAKTLAQMDEGVTQAVRARAARRR